VLESSSAIDRSSVERHTREEEPNLTVAACRVVVACQVVVACPLPMEPPSPSTFGAGPQEEAPFPSDLEAVAFPSDLGEVAFPFAALPLDEEEGRLDSRTQVEVEAEAEAHSRTRAAAEAGGHIRSLAEVEAEGELQTVGRQRLFAAEAELVAQPSL